MKSAILGTIAFVGGMLLFIGISSVFEYISVHNALSFALKNGIYQSSKVAMVPEIICELVENPEYGLPNANEEEESTEFIEVCEEVYKTEDEYFEMLIEAIESYKQGPFLVHIELMAYESVPFLARARLSATMESLLWDTTITVDEMVIAH